MSFNYDEPFELSHLSKLKDDTAWLLLARGVRCALYVLQEKKELTHKDRLLIEFELLTAYTGSKCLTKADKYIDDSDLHEILTSDIEDLLVTGEDNDRTP